MFYSQENINFKCYFLGVFLARKNDSRNNILSSHEIIQNFNMDFDRDFILTSKFVHLSKKMPWNTRFGHSATSEKEKHLPLIG